LLLGLGAGFSSSSSGSTSLGFASFSFLGSFFSFFGAICFIKRGIL
jgi:hypothetical protein